MSRDYACLILNGVFDCIVHCDYGTPIHKVYCNKWRDVRANPFTWELWAEVKDDGDS